MIVNTYRYAAGMMSFSLPGLGHLYLHQKTRALLWCIAFVVGFYFLKTQIIPWLPLISGWDAYRIKYEEKSSWRGILFGFVAGICLFVLMVVWAETGLFGLTNFSY